MIPAGSSSARVEERGGARNAMNLDRAQICEVQIELQRRGFEVGETDGMLGPRTKEALMAFQKRRGFQAAGAIDHDTFAALGQGRSETTGQAPRNAPPSGAGNNAQSNNPQGSDVPQASKNPGNRPGGGEPRTTGQSSRGLNGRQGNARSTQGEQRRNEYSR
jgi:peptidoglycan hydrolase-like protein with peptidoglycan-binding domain